MNHSAQKKILAEKCPPHRLQTEKDFTTPAISFVVDLPGVSLWLLAGVSNAESHMWICKPTGLNQGRGIFLIMNPEDVAAFRLKLQHTEEHKKMHHRQPQARIVQQWVNMRNYGFLTINIASPTRQHLVDEGQPAFPNGNVEQVEIGGEPTFFPQLHPEAAAPEREKV